MTTRYSGKTISFVAFCVTCPSPYTCSTPSLTLPFVVCSCQIGHATAVESYGKHRTQHDSTAVGVADDQCFAGIHTNGYALGNAE